jgi:predicted nucleotidyltransferase
MNTIVLINSTRNEKADAVLRGVIGIFETAFPGRIRGYYVEGSYSEGIGIATSDIDLEIVFKDTIEVEMDRKKAVQIGESCALLSAIELDIVVTDEKDLSRGIVPIFNESLPVYGEDVRDKFPLMSLAEWTHTRMHAAYWLTINVYNRPQIVTYPLAYPDPDGEFYGYDNRTMLLPDGREVKCTRNLIRTIGWIASALLAYKAGTMLAKKSECYKAYGAYLDAEGAQLLQDIYEHCRERWHYFIPESVEERRVLRDMCERTLAFENRFLATYKQFLLEELHSNNRQHIEDALRFQRNNPFHDAEIELA